MQKSQLNILSQWGRRRMLWLSFLLLFGILAGCGKSPRHEATPAAPASEPVQQTPPSEQQTNSATEKIPPVPGMTAEKLLRNVLDTYSKAKYYSDEAYVESLYEITLDNRKRLACDRRPCSIAFEKPNSIRMAVHHGLLVSDGKKLRGRIMLPAYLSEYVEWTSPLLISSIRELYPDARLAGAMELGVPDNVFWVPPQLVLLLSKNPLKTFLPENAVTTLIEPANLVRTARAPGKDERIVCDRVKIVAPDGTRIMWIDRKNNTLVRFEFPLELLEAPKNVDRYVGLTMEFPNVKISSEPQGSDANRKPFELEEIKNGTKVDVFLPLALKVCGEKAANVALRPLTSGYSEISLDKPNGVSRVLCFWKGTNERPNTPLPTNPKEPIPWPGQIIDYATESRVYMNEIDRVGRNHENDSSIEFISVNTDSVDEFSDSQVRMHVGDLGTFTSLYRFRDEKTRKNLLATVGVPCIMIVDSEGVIQKYYRQPVGFLRLDRDLKKMSQGRRLYDEDMLSFNSRLGLFKESIKDAGDNDCYRLEFESGTEDVVVRQPRQFPKSLKVEKLWSNSSFRHPSNPIAAPLVPSLQELVKGAAAPSGGTGPQAEREPFAIVPCEGNSLVLLDRRGQTIKKVTPEAATGELVNMVRAYRGPNDQVFFAASSRRLSKTVHRLDGHLEDLGSLDVSGRHGQCVADITLADVNGDGIPELFLGLLGDSISNEMPVHGLYAVDMKTQDILWKDENLFAPYRIGVVGSPDGNKEKHGTVLVMNTPEGTIGGLVEDHAQQGKRLREILLEDESSIQWFAVDSLRGDGQFDRVVLCSHQEPARLLLVGLSEEGKTIWKSPLPLDSVGWQMDSIVSGDVDGDGIKDWIVLSPDGTILFYSRDGRLIDQFQYGAEVTGACVVHRGKDRFLVVTDVESITAWQLK